MFFPDLFHIPNKICLVYFFSPCTRPILLLRLYNSFMIKFLMAITSAVKLDMDFVILSKLRSTFEKLSLVDLLHSISISNSLTFTDYLV